MSSRCVYALLATAGAWVLRKCELWQSGLRGCTLSDGKSGVAAPERGPGLPILHFPRRNGLSDCHYSTFLSRHGPSAPVAAPSSPLAVNQSFNHGGKSLASTFATSQRRARPYLPSWRHLNVRTVSLSPTPGPRSPPGRRARATPRWRPLRGRRARCAGTTSRPPRRASA